ncbi:MAG: response regulator transcription factor [Cellulomonas sp.]|uniref:DNA-binding response regulator n=1 Tax=Cellulomonas gelida TaxID=1712 RepID=A0A4Y3KPE4_9CELL|nr:MULTISPECIES: response regulator transcription factor [Cellulomonas]MCR6648668.1 response regulator transcription factor [Cellulomonas sp.]MCR6704628.1 response regulator transcription factor [Cellulomonas sp.]GEA85773.1 DNA-binding response regulator [Cellulomonas gelida]GGL33411.1 DNA-binding response regulator [Cellulomonas gelida]
MSGVLVVEDEARIASFVAKGLKAAGYAPTVVGTAREALDLALTGDMDLMVLDIGLPDGDGFDVLRQVRAAGSRLPVIILTARSSVEDTVAGLEGGADDYMPKPFRFEELLARVRLRLRTEADSPDDTTVLQRGAVTLDLRSRRATVDGRSVDLSAREFALAETFLRNAGTALSREQLLSRVWGYDFDPSSNVVDVYVRYLRTKLGAELISTVRGVGYRFEA